MEEFEIVQRVRVEASEREGYAKVIQMIPLPFVLGDVVREYEVEIDMVEKFIEELDKMFREIVEELLRGVLGDGTSEA